MKRFERRRLERVRRIAVIVGLSFSLGALADAGLAWRVRSRPLAVEPVVASAADVTDAATSSTTPAQKTSGPAGTRDAVTSGDTSHVTPVATSGSAAERRLSASDDDGEAIEVLRNRVLDVPVEGVSRRDLKDTFPDARDTSRTHEALDIMASRRTPVLAVEDGTIARLFTSKAGGLTIYQFDPSGRFSYYYAHLDSYAPGLVEHHTVQRGQVLGYVGSTGNASPDAPHLHFAIFRLTPERQWWKGDPLNPFLVLR